jgi:hypothetical protein
MPIIGRDRDDVTILEGTTWFSWPRVRKELLGPECPPTGESGTVYANDMDRLLDTPLW